MKVRMVFAMLIAAAMLLAPFAMRSGAAMAMGTSVHAGQMADKGLSGTGLSDTGHCSEQAGQQNHEDAPGDSICKSMCNGVVMAAAAPVLSGDSPAPLLTAAPNTGRHGVSAKLPTPPPRLS